MQFTEEGLREIMLKTSKGNMLVMDEHEGEEEEEVETRDFNLADEGEALIGFKGKYGPKIIKSLGMYKATVATEGEAKP